MGGHLTCSSSDLQCKWLPRDTCLSISSFLGSWLLHDVTFTHILALCHLVEVRTSLEKNIGSVLNLKIDLSFFVELQFIYTHILWVVLYHKRVWLRLCSVCGSQEEVGWPLSFCLTLETGSFTELGDRLEASKLQQFILCPLSQCLGYRCICGLWTQVPMLT